MNKNKIIFLIILGLLVAFVLWLVLLMNSDKQVKKEEAQGVSSYSIWMYQDDADILQDVILAFKEKYPDYSSTNFIIESFSDYEDYTYSLVNAFSQGKGPDLFTLNNSEKVSFVENKILGVHPSIINPNDFRKKYAGVFSDDLVATTQVEENGEKVNLEYLRGVPIGYETLGVFYNRTKQIRSSDFKSLGSMNQRIRALKDRYGNIIPLAIGNGSTVTLAGDIITQFFLQENGISGLADVTGGKMKSSLTSYMMYGDTQGDNAYNLRFNNMKNLEQNDLDLFVKNEAFMLVGYPRTLMDIDAKGYNKKFLLAEPFPFYSLAEGKTSINYNYFVKNIDSQNDELSNTLLKYFASESGADEYLDAYDYYLPALLSLESEYFEERIIDGYSITLGDFYNTDHLLHSFDVGIKHIFDREIQEVLDDSSNYLGNFEEMQTQLLCRTKKYQNLTNLSHSCK